MPEGSLASASGSASGALQRFEHQKPEMGLPFRIVLYAPDRTVRRKASDHPEDAGCRLSQTRLPLSILLDSRPSAKGTNQRHAHPGSRDHAVAVTTV